MEILGIIGAVIIVGAVIVIPSAVAVLVSGLHQCQRTDSRGYVCRKIRGHDGEDHEFTPYSV